MRALGGLLGVLGAALVLSGCFRDAYLHAETVPADPGEVWIKSKRITGSDCLFSLFGFIPFGSDPLVEARSELLGETEGTRVVDLVVEEDYVYVLIGLLKCTTVTGTAAIRAGSTGSSGSARPARPTPAPRPPPVRDEAPEREPTVEVEAPPREAVRRIELGDMDKMQQAEAPLRGFVGRQVRVDVGQRVIEGTLTGVRAGQLMVSANGGREVVSMLEARWIELLE